MQVLKGRALPVSGIKVACQPGCRARLVDGVLGT